MKLLELIKRIDTLGACIILVLAALATGGLYAALHLGWFRSSWEMAAWLVVGLAFLAVGFGVQTTLPPRNTNVYGAAKPASESEAQAAARGSKKAAPLHDQTFPD